MRRCRSPRRALFACRLPRFFWYSSRGGRGFARSGVFVVGWVFPRSGFARPPSAPNTPRIQLFANHTIRVGAARRPPPGLFRPVYIAKIVNSFPPSPVSAIFYPRKGAFSPRFRSRPMRGDIFFGYQMEMFVAHCRAVSVALLVLLVVYSIQLHRGLRRSLTLFQVGAKDYCA